MQVDHWFPTTIYSVDLTPDQQTYDGMISYVDNFYEKIKSELQASTTGDVNGDHQIYNSKEFEWLNNEISFHCKRYLDILGVDAKQVNLYAQKAWPVVCNRGGGYVQRHKHVNSVISAAYWLQVDDNSGAISFWCSNSAINNLPLNFYKTTFENTAQCFYPPVKNKLILFPSSLQHQVSPHYGEELRYSVSYDITVVSKPQANCEHFIMDPSLWKCLP